MDRISIIISILSIKGVGQVTAKKLLPTSDISTENELVDFLQEKAAKISRLELKLDYIKSGIEKAKRIIFESEKSNILFLSQDSPLYPSRLAALEKPPLILSYKGDVNLLNRRCVAVIGTREPTMFGKVAAYNCGKTLAETEFITVSGLAKGIDSFAHLGCLELGGKTIAVVGNGLDFVYPRENRLLAKKILDGSGLIVTECFIGEGASPGNLLHRNRIQVGLCSHVIAIETGLHSGSAYTVNLSIKMGRKVGCITYADEKC